VCSASAAEPAKPAYLDVSRPLEERVADLVSRMTLEEKAGLMRNGSPGVPRLGVPKYDWWNEALHGVARAGHATVFPQAIGMAATWNDSLMRTIARAIATEARAKYNAAPAEGNAGARYYGLTFWSPNINIFRDPRWGRGQETYGEDPFLTSRLGVAFVRGLQGEDPRYLMAAACAKHFAVHSGPESLRHHFDAEPNEADLHDTYLPAFEALVREGRVGAVMTAYNSLDGKPCAVNPRLYSLLNQWGFDGYVVSDCGAIRDLDHTYKIARDDAGAEALAIGSGLCLRCGDEAPAIAEAVRRGLIAESVVDRRLGQLLRTQFKLGIFDPPEVVPFSRIPISENDSPAHAATALEAARESIVLLKNDGTLPLRAAHLRRVAVIGPNANSEPALVGNYAGLPSAPVTVLSGLTSALGPGTVVDYVRGCDFADAPSGLKVADRKALVSGGNADLGLAVAAARKADAVIFVGGLTAQLEGEEMRVDYPGFSGGDRTRIELPETQERMLEALQATGRPVVLVLMSGSAVAIPWAAGHVNAIVEAWYPGQSGGTAVADVLLGHINPAGRLPVTLYRSTADLPAFENYSMAGRTYRYFGGTALYPFGHGLSYTHFTYSGLQAEASADTARNAVATARLQIANDGACDGDEVVQLYLREPENAHPRALRSLCGFERIHLARGETRTVSIAIPRSALRRWDAGKGQYTVPSGRWTVLAGASSLDIRQTTALNMEGLSALALSP